jgi:RimJ/RimL family protein N-acetyltransferase
MRPTEIIEDGLLLRPWRDSDADAVHRACQDPDIQRWTTVPSPYLPEHATGFVTGIAPAAWAAGTGAPLAVCAAGTGELLGSCGLVSIDRALASGEVGYWTAPWARGRGVAVRATRAVARWAFDQLGLRRLVWQAEVGNHASRLVALRAGFRVEGRLRLAHPHPMGGPDGWIGSLLPGDLAGTATGAGSAAGPDPLDVRRAAVFGRPQPVLFATTADGEIRLRRPEERDIDDLVEACRDAESVRWTTVPDPYRRADGEFFVHELATVNWARGTGAVFAVADPDDRYAGSVELRISPADPLVADVGFLTAPRYRGRGYMPAALGALAVWGFATLGLARIEWRANVGNVASRRAAEKAGFVHEGTARHGIEHRGKRMDAWVAALVAEDVVT